MRYVKAKAKEKVKDTTYRIYVTDSLKMISENTANTVSGGKYFNIRYLDAISDKPVDNRTGDEIIAGIREKLQKLG